MRRIPHDSVYTDRLSERALCYDFPADKAFIDGLYAMQSYFVARGCNIDIPVLRVMNTVHWLVAYLYATSCSGEQLEYDALTYNSVGRDKQLMYVSLIVLIAMLNRTEGARAKACRSMMLENRPEDFYEGVSLYEQWLEGGLEHYTDEDFQIDLMDEVNLLKQENQRLTYENQQLKTRINMKEDENRHVTNVYNYGTYNDIHDNPHATIYATAPVPTKEEVAPNTDDEVPTTHAQNTLPFVAPEKLAQLDLYSITEFEDLYRKAVDNDAKTLAAFLKKYADLKVLDFNNFTKRQIFDTLKEKFPQIRFGYRNFTQYF